MLDQCEASIGAMRVRKSMTKEEPMTRWYNVVCISMKSRVLCIVNHSAFWGVHSHEYSTTYYFDLSQSSRVFSLFILSMDIQRAVQFRLTLPSHIQRYRLLCYWSVAIWTLYPSSIQGSIYIDLTHLSVSINAFTCFIVRESWSRSFLITATVWPFVLWFTKTSRQPYCLTLQCAATLCCAESRFL